MSTTLTNLKRASDRGWRDKVLLLERLSLTQQQLSQPSRSLSVSSLEDRPPVWVWSPEHTSWCNRTPEPGLLSWILSSDDTPPSTHHLVVPITSSSTCILTCIWHLSRDALTHVVALRIRPLLVFIGFLSLGAYDCFFAQPLILSYLFSRFPSLRRLFHSLLFNISYLPLPSISGSVPIHSYIATAPPHPITPPNIFYNTIYFILGSSRCATLSSRGESYYATEMHNSRPYWLFARYSVCRCLYYEHSVDMCSAYGTKNHHITERTVLVG